MITQKGRVFVLEGLDGCGKSTQLALTEKYLCERGIRYRTVSFPEYDSDSGRIISRYLSGSISCEGETGAYAASGFYASDRYISYVTDWKKDLDEGAVILCGRYSTSNLIYQSAKLPDEKRGEFMRWLADYEYKKLGLPEPALVIYLDMPISVSQKLLLERCGGDEKKRDIHERDTAFLRECEKCAFIAAELGGWKVIGCARDGEPLSREEVQGLIRKRIDKALEL